MTAIELRAVLALTLYKVSLDVAYYALVPSLEYYAVSSEVKIDVVKVIESYLLAWIVFVVMPKSSRRLSNVLLWLLISLSYIPMLTIYALNDESRAFVYMTTGFCLSVLMLVRVMPTVKIRAIRPSQARIVYVGLFVITIAISGAMAHELLSIASIASIADVYLTRDAFLEAELPLRGYYLHWLATALNPVLFGLCVVKKRWTLALGVSLVQLATASVVGMKSYYVILPLALGLMWVVKRKNPLAWTEGGFAGMTCAAGVVDYLFQSPWAFLFGVGRGLYVPAQLAFFYYDFFSTHRLIPFAYLFNFFFKIAVVDYPYEMDPANLIGKEYFGSPDIAAVTGVVGDAYMNLGGLGLVLWAVWLSMVLRLFDSCAKELDVRIGVAGVVMAVLSISGTYLVRSMITGGVGLSLILLYLLRSAEGFANRSRSDRYPLPRRDEAYSALP